MFTQRIFKYLLLLTTAIYIIYRLLICFNYQPELCNGESNNVWKSLSVANGEGLYNDPEKLPLEVFQYTPLFEFPVIFIAKILDKSSPDYLANVTMLGRLFVLVLNLLLTFIISKICFQFLSIDKIKSYACGLTSLLLLTHPIYAIRPDSTLLVFVFLTLLFYLQRIKKENYIFSISTYVIISLLFFLCFFSKQDGIFISIVIGIDLVLKRQIKQLFILSLTSLIILAILLGFGQLFYGEFFLKSIILGLNNTSSLSQLITVFEKAWSYYGIVLFLGITLSVYLLIQKTSLKIIPIATIFYFILAIFTSSKSGSWINYYTPTILLSTIVFFQFINQTKYDLKFVKVLGFGFAISVFLFFLRIFYNYTYPLVKQKKDEYYTTFQEIQTIKKKLNIKPETNILILNYLERNFLYENCIMMNTEYYGYSKYTYTQFKNDPHKPINFILYHHGDEKYIDYLSTLFNVNIKHYTHFRIDSFEVLKKPSI
jgi:hypothetical protein